MHNNCIAIIEILCYNNYNYCTDLKNKYFSLLLCIHIIEKELYMNTLRETIIYDLFTGLYTNEYFNQILNEQKSPYYMVTVTIENLEKIKKFDNVLLDVSKYLQKHPYISSRIENNKFSVIIPKFNEAQEFVSNMSLLNFKNEVISLVIDKK